MTNSIALPLRDFGSTLEDISSSKFIQSALPLSPQIYQNQELQKSYEGEMQALEALVRQGMYEGDLMTLE